MIGRMNGLPSEVMELTQRRVQQGRLGFEKRGILAIKAYELWFLEVLCDERDG